MSDEIDVLGLAFAYRRLVMWFGAQLVLGMARLGLVPTFSQGSVGEMLALVFLAAAVATTCALAYYGYKTAEALGSSVGWLWALAMFVPCVNALTLLALSSKATGACRTNGIPVGFFGPKIDAGRDGYPQ